MVSSPTARRPAARYRERLTVPWWTWLLALFWASTLGIAYGHSLGAPLGWAVGAAALALSVAGLWHVSTLVVVDEHGLTVGESSLPHACIGVVQALDAAAARRLRGPDADPRRYTALRGWVRTAVTVEVVDPRDPTPSWYVSTRRPAELAAALERGTDPSAP